MRFQKYTVLAVAAVMAGCTATTSLQSKDPNVVLRVNKNAAMTLHKPVATSYSTTSFGQYQFKAEKQGTSPFYGIMPLKFNGGYLAADILFFAPAALFNLREVFPFYEFDVDTGTIRYKKNASDPWVEYKPTAAETERAKQFFTGLDNAATEKPASK